MEISELQNICQSVIEISLKAGEKIMEVYESADFSVEHKSDDSPLTRADYESNKIICEGLESMEPLFPIISEENKEIDYQTRKDYEYCWMVDPLDGTKEFIKRNGEFTVNVALIHNGSPIMGVVYAPVLDKVYYAIKSQGAWIGRDKDSKKLKANAFTMQDPGLRVVCSRSHLNPETQSYVDDLLVPETVSKGSSLKFLILAEGGAELYPRLAPTMEWDTAAAHIILEEAGGKVVEATSGLPLKYNKENLLNPHFFATGTVG